MNQREHHREVVAYLAGIGASGMRIEQRGRHPHIVFAWGGREWRSPLSSSPGDFTRHGRPFAVSGTCWAWWADGALASAGASGAAARHRKGSGLSAHPRPCSLLTEPRLTRHSPGSRRCSKGRRHDRLRPPFHGLPNG